MLIVKKDKKIEEKNQNKNQTDQSSLHSELNRERLHELEATFKEVRNSCKVDENNELFKEFRKIFILSEQDKKNFHDTKDRDDFYIYKIMKKKFDTLIKKDSEKAHRPDGLDFN